MERLIFNTQTNEREAICEAHGKFMQKCQTLGYLNHKIWLGCPACDIEEQQKKESLEAAQQAAQQEAAYQNLLGRSSLPIRFIGKNFDNFIADTPEKQFVLSVAKDFAKNFETHLQNGSGLIFLGGVGTGKSHLAAAIIQALLPKHVGVYVTVADYLRTFRETWRPNSEHTGTQVIRRFVSAPLLVLDELGKQYATENEHNDIFDVLDGRYREKKPTIVMGNLMNNELVKYLGERLTDRLRETNKAIAFGWGSYRLSESRRVLEDAFA